MSIEATRWVLREAPIPNPTPEGMPPASSLAAVLFGLANHASADGRGAYPSKGTLAQYTRLSERQVQRCIGALAELGLIVKGDARIAAIYARDGYRPNVWDLPISGETAGLPSPDEGRQNRPSGETKSTVRGDARVSQTVLKPSLETTGPDADASALNLDVAPVLRPKRKTTALPDDWAPSGKHHQLSMELGFTRDRTKHEAEQFRDRALAKGERYLDWDAAFRTWLRNAKKFDDRNGGAARPGRFENAGRDERSGLRVER